MKTGYKLRDLMKTRLVAAEAGESAVFGAKLMGSSKIGSLLVMRDGNTVGIVTEKDIIRKVLAKNLDPSVVALGGIMNSPVLSMDVDADMYDAYVFLNEQGIRHLPVSEKGKIVGIVTMSDLLRVEPGVMETVFHKGQEVGTNVQ